jgi:hypothetical protein
VIKIHQAVAQVVLVVEVTVEAAEVLVLPAKAKMAVRHQETLQAAVEVSLKQDKLQTAETV